MNKYRCKNGKIALVDEKEDCIYIEYEGKRHERSKDVIGKALFPLNDNVVKSGHYVAIIQQGSKGEPWFLYIYEPKTKLEYRRMGGSYYGATVDSKPVFDEDLNLPSGIESVTTNSPIGKALFGKQAGDEIEVSMPNNTIEKYIILFVSEEPM